MSLHLNRQCQRADALPPPVRFVPGIGCTDQEEARNERRPVSRPRPLLEGHICVTLTCVNRLFAVFIAVRRSRSSEQPFGNSSLETLNKLREALFKPLTYFKLKVFQTL